MLAGEPCLPRACHVPARGYSCSCGGGGDPVAVAVAMAAAEVVVVAVVVSFPPTSPPHLL